MACEGHRFVITDSSDANLLQVSGPKKDVLSRPEFLERIKSLVNRTRGSRRTNYKCGEDLSQTPHLPCFRHFYMWRTISNLSRTCSRENFEKM